MYWTLVPSKLSLVSWKGGWGWNGDEKRKQSKANVERVRLEVV